MKRSLVVMLNLAIIIVGIFSVHAPAYVFAEEIQPEGIIINEMLSWPTFRRDNARMGNYLEFIPKKDNLYSGDFHLYRWEAQDKPPVFSGPSVIWGLKDSDLQGFACVGAGDDVHCFDARTGDELWTATTGGGVHSTPTIAIIEGALTVFFGSLDSKVRAVHAENGSQKWDFIVPDMIGSSSIAVEQYSPGRVFFGAWDGKVYCLNASTGAHLWNYTTGGQVDSSPAVVDGRVFIGSNDGHVYCLDALTGVQLWNYTTGDWVVSTPAVVDGRLYVGSYDANVYCLNASTGTRIWNFTTGHFVSSSPAVADGRVFIGSYDCNVYGLNASTGAKLWNYTTGDLVMASPAVADDLLFIGSVDHNLYCLNTSDGSHVWNYTTGDMISASPAIANGILYVGSLDGTVYAFGTLISRYAVEPDGHQFDVEVMSNSRLSAFTLNQSMKTLSVNVTGDPGTSGYCAFTFPTELLGGPYECLLNGTLISPEVSTNATHTILAFTYTHSTHTLEIIGTTVIPEYPTPLAVLLSLLVLGLTLHLALGKVWQPRKTAP